MGSSSGGDYSPPDTGGVVASPGITPAPQSPAPPPWVRYPSFLPGDPSAMANGLTQNQVNAIDRWSLPAYLTPTEVEGGVQPRGPGVTDRPPAPPPLQQPTSLPLITRADLGNKPTGQMLALVGQEGTQQTRHQLADMMRRQRRQAEGGR
jgi:hypothetical protein